MCSVMQYKSLSEELNKNYQNNLVLMEALGFLSAERQKQADEQLRLDQYSLKAHLRCLVATEASLLTMMTEVKHSEKACTIADMVKGSKADQVRMHVALCALYALCGLLHALRGLLHCVFCCMHCMVCCAVWFAASTVWSVASQASCSRTCTIWMHATWQLGLLHLVRALTYPKKLIVASTRALPLFFTSQDLAAATAKLGISLL